MEYELFELIKEEVSNNKILTIPLEQLQLILQGNEAQSDYEIKIGSVNNIIFTKKGDKNLISVKCIKNYYNIEINNESIDNMNCHEIKEKYATNLNCTIVKQNCAACHLRAIQDYGDDLITRK